MPAGDGKGPPQTGGGHGPRDGRGRLVGGQGQQKGGSPGAGPKTGGVKGGC